MICRRNAPVLDVDNGTRGTVAAVDHHGGNVSVRTDPGATRVLPARYCAEHLEHANALTAHGMQGTTVEWAAVVGAPTELTRNWAYTALSRGRQPAELFITAAPGAHAAERAEIAPRRPGRPPGAPLSVAPAMQRRDDDDLAVDRITAGHLPQPVQPPTRDLRRHTERAGLSWAL